MVIAIENRYYSFLMRFSYLYYNKLQHSYRVRCNICINLKDMPFATENISEFKILIIISRSFAVNEMSYVEGKTITLSGI